MKAPKTDLFKKAGPGNIPYYQSTTGTLEIRLDEDEKSPHFGHWVLTRQSTFHDQDMYINDLAERNNITLCYEGPQTLLIDEVKKLKRFYSWTEHDSGVMYEDPTGDYVKYDDVLELLNRFQSK